MPRSRPRCDHTAGRVSSPAHSGRCFPTGTPLVTPEGARLPRAADDWAVGSAPRAARRTALSAVGQWPGVRQPCHSEVAAAGGHRNSADRSGQALAEWHRREPERKAPRRVPLRGMVPQPARSSSDHRDVAPPLLRGNDFTCTGRRVYRTLTCQPVSQIKTSRTHWEEYSERSITPELFSARSDLGYGYRLQEDCQSSPSVGFVFLQPLLRG